MGVLRVMVLLLLFLSLLLLFSLCGLALFFSGHLALLDDLWLGDGRLDCGLFHLFFLRSNDVGDHQLGI
jgi:hypothetical protein